MKHISMDLLQKELDYSEVYDTNYLTSLLVFTTQVKLCVSDFRSDALVLALFIESGLIPQNHFKWLYKDIVAEYIMHTKFNCIPASRLGSDEPPGFFSLILFYFYFPF